MIFLKSDKTGIHWPALTGGLASQLLAIQYQLDQSQWLTPDALRESQSRQLSSLLDHAVKTVPYYRERLGNRGFKVDEVIRPYGWQKIPILTREDIQAAGNELCSTNIPETHGKAGTIHTSGSTGRPIRTLSTGITRLFWSAFTLREHLWHSRDQRKKVVAIRPDRASATSEGKEFPTWGAPFDVVFETGPSAILHSSVNIEDQVSWLKNQAPRYLLSLPSNIYALVRAFRDQEITLQGLHHVQTLGETLKPEVRIACREVWGANVVDIYSAQEVGYIALQCPECENYHIQAENVLVEILDDSGQPCRTGETGRVVITTLHNFATPLIRYDIGDYAEFGEPCPCGRGLPVIRRILGRQRNMVTLPDGTRHWPSFPEKDWMYIAPIRQMQMIQKTTESIELKLVMQGELSDLEKEQLVNTFRNSLRYPFKFIFTYHAEIPRSKSGKFEDFVSEIS